MRVGLWSPVGLLLAGCAAAPLRWQTELDGAIAEASRTNRPLYVLSVFGDLSKAY